MTEETPNGKKPDEISLLVAVRRYPARLVPWLWRGQPVYFAALGLLAWPLAGLIASGLDDQIQYAGGILELAGLTLVLQGLLKVRKLFEGPTPRQRFLGWLRSIPVLRPARKKLHGSPTVVLTGAGKGTLRRGVPEGTALEDRVAALEHNFKALDQNFSTFRDATRKETRTLRDEHAKETAKLRAAQATLAEQFAEFAVADWDYEVVGFIWVFFGLAMNAFSGVIASLGVTAGTNGV